MEFNKANNIYYDNAERGFRPHNYLDLYKEKSLRVIGKICARITAVEKDGEIQHNEEFGDLTDERKQMILKAMDDVLNYGYNLKITKHRYFFVDNFYETDFKKISKGGCIGSRIFDLTEVLENENIPEVSELAEKLINKTWQ